MNTPILTRHPRTVERLQRDAEWARDTYEMHWDVCRSRMAGRDCLKCDHLDDAAFAAERAYLEARDAN